MGGDHKCPVCQATFTRPQHVARHMRSHTGDRPYKCQHCGDQFARSDLLSRHINKCHANEKPPQNPGSSRRKGSASASRATTSKQACDQCVQSSLPCDGSNPCTKCTHRKARCTYVKFHRQTAPVGPGHNPRPNAPPNSNLDPPSSISSSRIPISYAQPDDFFLAPAPPSSVPTSMAETLYNAQSFAFPPLYPDSSSTAPHTDFTSKYRAQAELLRNTTALTSNGHFAPAGGTDGPVGPGFPGSANLSPPGVYSDPRSASGGSSWVSWSHDQDPSDSYDAAQQQSLHDKDMHRGHDSLSHHSHPQQQQHHQYVNHHGITHGLQQLPSGARTYPHQAQASASYLRRGSVEFGGSDGSSSAAEHSSIPSSASSSSVHLPLDNLTLQQNQGQHAHMLSFNALEDLSNHNRDYASAGSQDPAASGNNKLATDINNQSLATDGASFFPNMNMEMGGIPSLSGLPTDDPDATPMPLRESAPPVSLALPMRSASTSALNSGATPREVDSKEMRDFWKQYMRTPLSGPGPAAASESQSGANSSQQHQHQVMSPPGARRPRVASMPSSKTPTIVFSGQNGHQSQETDANRGGESGVRTTLQDDLRSYEAAVMARKAPTNLSLVPKARRGTMPAVGPTAYSGPTSITQGGSPVVAGKGIGVVPSVKLDLLRQSAATDARPGSSSTTHSGSPRDSSLAGAFGVQQHLQGSPHLSSFALRRGSPGSSTGDSSSRASSVSVDQEGDTDDDAASGESGRVGRLRPAFKRLASQTLGPPNAKRAFFVPPATMGGDVKEQQELEQHQHEAGVGVDVGRDEYGQGYAPGALGMH